MIKRDWAALLLPGVAFVAPAHAVDYLSVAQAQTLLFPGAQRFAEQPLKLDDAQRKRVRELAGVRQRQEEQPLWRVDGAEGLRGWFMVDEVIGKHEFITYAAAISPDGHVLGVEIMSYRETHGGQVRDAAWRKHLAGKTLADPFKLDVDVPNISGATLSCRNVMDGVKRLLVLHQLFLTAPGGGPKTSLAAPPRPPT